MAEKPSIKLAYEPIEVMAKLMGEAATTYDNSRTVLQAAAAEFQSKTFVGLTGNAMAEYLGVVGEKLKKLSTRATEMQNDLMTVVKSFRGEVDPNIANRFKDGK